MTIQHWTSLVVAHYETHARAARAISGVGIEHYTEPTRELEDLPRHGGKPFLEFEEFLLIAR